MEVDDLGTKFRNGTGGHRGFNCLVFKALEFVVVEVIGVESVGIAQPSIEIGACRHCPLGGFELCGEPLSAPTK